MDFLAYASVVSDINSKDIIVLNSVSMLDKAVNAIDIKVKNGTYTHIESYLDNDTAWIEATKQLKSAFSKDIETKKIIFKNKSNLFKKHKDFNDYIIARRDKKVQELQHYKSHEALERVRQRDTKN